ncbi:trypsin-like peptidase domain-containing protein [Streptomyces sp. NPDC002688]|uniref:nSTAND1 domain-containing NTPase n=1 Tax=Streptomyces sp. NPDC002688 TaxID=3154423 RepID=UPI0033217B0B
MAALNESGSGETGLGGLEWLDPEAAESESTDAPGDDGATGSGGKDGLAFSIARIETQDGRTAGTGFIVAPGILLTCAHVVALAGEGPGGRVWLVFPHLPGAPRTTARVMPEGWRAADSEDIAVLRLDKDAPAGGRPVRLGSAAGSRGHRVRSFGFPAQAPRGGHFGYGRAGDLLPAGSGPEAVLQLTDANDLTTGFSGGPLLDDVTGLVIGMVTSITHPDKQSRGLNIAYATPTHVLRSVRPELAEHDRCPYRALEPFTEQHVAWFHGRQAAVAETLAQLRRYQPVLLLLGPSGAGKSSLVRAGLLPALTGGGLPGSDRWVPLLARPGGHLAAELEQAGLSGATTDGILPAVRQWSAVAPGDRRPIVIIDQFEELLTDTGEQADTHLAAAEEQLVELINAGAAATVILIMRDDFYPLLAARAPALLKEATPGLFNVPASLAESDLHAIVTEPARTVGLHVEDGLAERIVSDVLAADPLAATTRQAPTTLLPLIQLTLSQLWERRHDGRLTHRAYDRIGGVTGSLTTWCDTALNSLPGADHPTAQRLLTTLVRPGDATNAVPATRRQVLLTDLRELAGDVPGPGPGSDGDFDRVFAALTHRRIVTTRTMPRTDGTPGPATAELMHEALIREWGDLRRWVAADHQFQDWLDRAGKQYKRYAKSSDPGDLLDGSDLAEGTDWAKERGLPSTVASFLTRSTLQQQAELRRTRRVNVALSCFLALALIAAGVAFWQREKAITAQRVAQSQEMAAQYAAIKNSDPDVAALLAVQAYRVSPTEEAVSVLHAAAASPLQSVLTGHSAPVYTAAFSPDGTTVATGDMGGKIRLWASDGTPRRTLVSRAKAVASVAFSPDGRTLASAGNDGVVRLWDPRTGDLRAALTGHNGGALSVAFSPDGHMLATGGADGTARLWDPVAGRVRAVMAAHTGPVRSVAFTPDGASLITAGEDKAVKVWDVATAATRRTLRGDDKFSTSAVSPDGRTLAAAGDGGKIILWHLATGRVKKTITTNFIFINSLDFGRDDRFLAVGSDENTATIWNTDSGSENDSFPGHADSVLTVAFGPDGRTLLTGSNDHSARLWDTKTSEAEKVLREPAGPVRAAAFSPDGRTLAGGGEKGILRLWDPATGKALRRLMGHTALVTSVDFSPDGRTLATGSSDRTVRLWDVATGRALRTLKGHSDFLSAVAFSPDGRTLATGGIDDTVRLWDTTTWRIRKTLRVPGGVFSVAFSPDGRSLATGDAGSRTVRLWDPRSGRMRRTIMVRTPGISAVAFAPDGRTLLTSSMVDSAVHLWDTASGTPRRTLGNHNGYVYAAVFSRDGRTLISATATGWIYLWDMATARLQKILTGHEYGVYALTANPDGRAFASASDDGTLRLWGLSSPDPAAAIRRICRALHRDFTPEERTIYLKGKDVEGPVCPPR